MNIILIGMPGAGKSTLGVLLAKSLARPFCDTDLIIQTRAGRTLQDIIEHDGLSAFMEIENQVGLGVGDENAVIATGGSMVYHEEAMAHLKETGKVVYLSLPLEEIVRRVQNIATRGIAAPKGQSLSDIMKERRPLYERYADITLDCTSLDTEKAIEKLVKLLDGSCPLSC